MRTSRKLWIGFGTLTALLVLLGLTVVGRIQAIKYGVEELSNIVRLRSVAAAELEFNAIAYVLQVHEYLVGRDPEDKQKAREHAAVIHQRKVDYDQWIRSGRQREISARFATSWAALEALGESLMSVENSPPPELLTRFDHLGSELEDFLGEEMQPDAAEALRVANESTSRDLDVSRSSVLLVLLAGVSIALVTSKRVSTGVLQTERELADVHRRLEESFALLDTMFSKAPVGLAFLDREGLLVRINESLAAMNELPAGDQLGKAAKDALPRLWPTLEPRLRQVIEEGRAVVNFEVPNRDGDAEHWLVSYYPILHNGRGVIGVGVVVVDVTDQKRAAELLREADRKKDEFLATLAHELRNPLAPLQNALHLLRRARERHVLNTALGCMERQLDQMVRLVDDLLDVSRIAGGKLELQRERISLSAVVQSAVESSRPLIDARGHALTVSLPREPVYIHADPTRLAQVFLNLLNNSAKYTREGGKIWLTAELRGSDVVVRVRDDGIGIPAEVLPHVFDMFIQADRTLERTTGGLGIGLTLARRLVEMHGGAIAAHSEGVGRGTEVTVTLPVLDAPKPFPAAQPESAARPAAAHRHRILVVDDVADIADSLAMVLEMMGHEVRTAGDGLTALSVGEGFHPDIVLLDIGMPHLNGYDTCRRMRETPWGKRAVLVAQTGWGSEGDRQRTREAGFDLHLVKPVDPDVLMDRIEALLPR